MVLADVCALHAGGSGQSLGRSIHVKRNLLHLHLDPRFDGTQVFHWHATLFQSRQSGTSLTLAYVTLPDLLLYLLNLSVQVYLSHSPDLHRFVSRCLKTLAFDELRSESAQVPALFLEAAHPLGHVMLQSQISIVLC